MTAAYQAKALYSAWRTKHGVNAPPMPGILYALAQSLGEGAGDPSYAGTNNAGSMHATTGFARAHANDVGYGMVAYGDSGPFGPYITRMRAYPSAALGMRDFLDAVERNVELGTVSDATTYATGHYVHGYFTGWHPNAAERAADPGAAVTPLKDRAAAVAAGTLNKYDLEDIAEYAQLLESRLPSARAAWTAIPTEAGDVDAITIGPPFAPLASRLHASSLDAARARLGRAATDPPPGAISIADALAAPNGEGVWLFGVAPNVQPAPTTSSSSSSAGTVIALLFGVVAAAGAGVAIDRASSSASSRRRAA